VDAFSVVYYDGQCRLCNRAIRFIAYRDPHRRFRFCALQSPRGQQAARRAGLQPMDVDSMILEENGVLYTRSVAALRIAGRLRAPWPVLRLLVGWLPAAWLDRLYDAVARRRFRWFGRQDDACPLFDAALTPDRFLDASEERLEV
jgi:predicted DCC family thiol-disulfide oxidoreductase YuxK